MWLCLSPQPLGILACKRIVWLEAERQRLVLLDEFVFMATDRRKASTVGGSAEPDSSCCHPSWLPSSGRLQRQRRGWGTAGEGKSLSTPSTLASSALQATERPPSESGRKVSFSSSKGASPEKPTAVLPEDGSWKDRSSLHCQGTQVHRVHQQLCVVKWPYSEPLQGAQWVTLSNWKEAEQRTRSTRVPFSVHQPSIPLSTQHCYNVA